MASSRELLVKRLSGLFAQHGSASDFCRRTGIPRATLENWLKRGMAPDLDSLDKIAEGLGLTAAELIRPPNDAQDDITKLQTDLERVQEALNTALEDVKKLSN